MNMHCEFVFSSKGFLLAIHRCLTEVTLTFESRDKWQRIVVSLLRVIRCLIDIVLTTLGGKIHDIGRWTMYIIVDKVTAILSVVTVGT